MVGVRGFPFEAGAVAVVAEGLTAVVLGSTGFVGRALLRLIGQDPEVRAVRCLVRSPGPHLGTEGITYHRGDLQNLPDDLFPGTPYVVYHLATEQHEAGPDGFVAHNMRNARSLGEQITPQCHGLIYTSSLSVLGAGRQRRVDETTSVTPGTELAAARAAVESYLLSLGGRLMFPVYCVRTRFVLGHGDTRTLPGLHRFLRSGLMLGTGRQRFTVIDVDDLAAVLLALGRRCEERYSLGAPVWTAINAGYRRPITLAEIRAILRATVGGIPPVVIPLPTALRCLRVLPFPWSQTLAGKIELFGLSHWSAVDRLEAEIGTVVTGRDPRETFRVAALGMAQDKSPLTVRTPRTGTVPGGA
jgi:nucleoside-diphosphate-sugar epimerase